MDKNIQKPHILVVNEVQRQWSSHRFKGFYQWILELGQIKPKAIEIIQTENYDIKHNMCVGETLNKWRYDETGFRLLHPNENIKDKVTETCSFCIDKEHKRVLVEWSNILGSASSRKNIHYFHTGTLYELFMHDGIEDFDIISSWME